MLRWVEHTAITGSRLYGDFPKLGVHFKGPHNRDSLIWGPVVCTPYFGKLPYQGFRERALETSQASMLDLARGLGFRDRGTIAVKL